MPVNPRFLAARAAERRQRDLAHLRALAWLPLRRGGVVFTRAPLVPLTLRHTLELRLARNAFFTPQPALLGDVFLFLWRLHPLYRTPQLARAPLVAELSHRRLKLLRLWLALGSFEAAFCHRRLTRLVRQCDLSAAVASIEGFIEVAYQDVPGDDVSGDGRRRTSRRSSVAPERHAADNTVDYLMSNYHLSHDQALDLPISLINQLYRDRMFSDPECELKIFAPSDALL